MRKEQIGSDVWRVPVAPLDMTNVYIVRDVLIDAGIRQCLDKLLVVLEQHEISGHALTHGHADHQGCSHAICGELDVPLYCGEGDRHAIETGDLTSLMPRKGPLAQVFNRAFGGPRHQVSRTLKDGDEIGGFTVIETPGHTPGHLAFWREEGRILILGDVLFHRNPVTCRKGLTEPFRFATYDTSANLASARKLASLEPDVICFGHGPPLRDGATFQRFIQGLA